MLMPLSTTWLELVLDKEQALEVAATILAARNFLEFLMVQMTSTLVAVGHAAAEVVKLSLTMMQTKYVPSNGINVTFLDEHCCDKVFACKVHYNCILLPTGA